ncbi:MAG: PIG-L family deacetylase [Bryobacteraceae bacterium]|nr:PIG-L family deacetylase [Bryobacteraceae bacterium]
MGLPRRQATCLALIVCLLSPLRVAAQRELAGAPEMKQALDRLNVLGAALMIAAHPDDENTGLLTYLARGRKVRTIYLSITRGEGGQNLIGPEQGDLLGVIRTQELLASRRIDGAEQRFTRAIDFGFSKTAEETMAKWGREEILGDIVWTIRDLRPDIVILRFSGSASDGHGHHQSSAMLGKEAFAAAADPNRFPQQLEYVKPWQARRLFWNVFSFRGGRFSDAGDMPERVDVDLGEYDPVLGYSYAELAGMGRSMHRSQGFGAGEPKGAVRNSLVVVAGEPAHSDPFEGVDTTWDRVPGGAAAGAILKRAAERFRPERPQDTAPLLLQARAALAGIRDEWADRKRAELDETIALAAGLWLDAAADRYAVVPGSAVAVDCVAVNRSDFPLELLSVSLGAATPSEINKPLPYNQPFSRRLEWKIPADFPYTHPYWLQKPKDGERYAFDDLRELRWPENPPALEARFVLRAGGQEIPLTRPVLYRYVDRVLGERTRALAVVPPAGVAMVRAVKLFPDDKPRSIEAQITANIPEIKGALRLEAPPGWRITPEAQPFELSESGRQATLRFEAAPPASPADARLEAVAAIGAVKVRSGVQVIEYPHIPTQTLTPPARERLVRADVRNTAKSVGYVMGAGDEVPDALRELGSDVTLLAANDLARGDLHRFDAIVTGVRAYNVRDDLIANQPRLMSYVEQGGTLIVQYNVADRQYPPGGRPERLSGIGPYPLATGRVRVSVEEAPVRFLRPDDPLLTTPNRIGPADFDGWVQERGLYFASEWDARYTPLWEMNDPGEPSAAGATLCARYGKGVYIFTALSWFRQLPAGVPGAYRIFANFLSAGAAAQ